MEADDTPDRVRERGEVRRLGSDIPACRRRLRDGAARVLRTPFVEEWLGRTQDARRDAGRLRDEVLSAIGGRTTHELLPFTGQRAGMVHDVLPAREIVERMVAEAELALTRVDGFRSPGA